MPRCLDSGTKLERYWPNIRCLKYMKNEIEDKEIKETYIELLKQSEKGNYLIASSYLRFLLTAFDQYLLFIFERFDAFR
jgi:hypothetical protein